MPASAEMLAFWPGVWVENEMFVNPQVVKHCKSPEIVQIRLHNAGVFQGLTVAVNSPCYSSRRFVYAYHESIRILLCQVACAPAITAARVNDELPSSYFTDSRVVGIDIVLCKRFFEV